MLFGLVILLVLAWFLGYSVFPVGGKFIHLLLVLAAIILVGHILRRGRANEGGPYRT